MNLTKGELQRHMDFFGILLFLTQGLVEPFATETVNKQLL